jgi:hypothetical protein
VARGHRLYYAAMAVYRVCLLGPAGKLEAVWRISEDSTKAVLASARDMLKSDVRLSGFEVWKGARRIHAEARKIGGARLGKPVGEPSARQDPEASIPVTKSRSWVTAPQKQQLLSQAQVLRHQ